MNFEIDRKTDRIIRTQILDEDITDIQVDWRFWDSSGTIAIEKSTTDGSIVKTDAANGEIEMELDNTDTDIEPGNYDYEVLITDVEDNRYLPKKGVLTIKQNKSSEV